MFDFLNCEVLQDDFCMEGNYYARRPVNYTDAPILFTYTQVDPQSKDYNRIMSNIRADSQRCAIRTNTAIDFQVKGYVSTQDGVFWQIESVSKSVEVEKTKEALRVIKEPPAVEYVLRLLAVENPWGLK